MYETIDAHKPNLSEDTIRRMREVFDGQHCCHCGEAASRLSGEKFYCALHFVRRSAKPGDNPKTCRCLVAM